MKGKSLAEKSAGLPVAILPTMVGAVTLSNVYSGTFGFTWIRHITTISAIIIWIFALIKILKHNATFRAEYKNTVLASLYAGFTLLMMLFGAYILPYSIALGKALWLAGIVVQVAHICVFTYNNVIKSFKIDTFVPSWFVTYNSIMVSVVIGAAMNEPLICSVLLYYGLAVYMALAAFLIIRIATKPLDPKLLHTKAIFLAPSSLCFVSYITANKNPKAAVVYLLYGAVLISFLYFMVNVPEFFSIPFSPGFAGMTFPNSIGVVASIRMAEYLETAGKSYYQIVYEIAGIQLFITTAVIAFVLYNFLSMFIKSYSDE